MGLGEPLQTGRQGWWVILFTGLSERGCGRHCEAIELALRSCECSLARRRPRGMQAEGTHGAPWVSLSTPYSPHATDGAPCGNR